MRLQFTLFVFIGFNQCDATVMQLLLCCHYTQSVVFMFYLIMFYYKCFPKEVRFIEIMIACRV